VDGVGFGDEDDKAGCLVLFERRERHVTDLGTLAAEDGNGVLDRFEHRGIGAVVGLVEVAHDADAKALEGVDGRVQLSGAGRSPARTRSSSASMAGQELAWRHRSVRRRR